MRAKPRPLRRTSTTPSSLARKAVEREVVAPELEGVGALALGPGERGVELGLVVRVEPQRPVFGVGDVGGPPLRHRFELVQFPCTHACSFRRGAARAGAAHPPVRPPRTSRPGRAPVASPSR